MRHNAAQLQEIWTVVMHAPILKINQRLPGDNTFDTFDTFGVI